MEHVKPIRDGLSAIVSILKTLKLATNMEQTKAWVAQIEQAGLGFKNLMSSTTDDQRKPICEAIGETRNKLNAVYLEMLGEIPDVQKDTQKEAGIFIEKFRPLLEGLVDGFLKFFKELTDEAFEKLKQTIVETLKEYETSVYHFGLQMSDSYKDSYGSIMVEEAVIGEYRLVAWQKMYRRFFRLMISLGLIDIKMNDRKKAATRMEPDDELSLSDNTYINGDMTHHFFKKHAADWIKFKFRNLFETKIKGMLDDDDNGLKDVAQFLVDSWREETGYENGSRGRFYQMIALRAHIPKDKDDFGFRISAYKIFNPNQCVVAENLYPPGIHGTAVDICIVMYVSNYDARYSMNPTVIKKYLRTCAEIPMDYEPGCAQKRLDEVTKGLIAVFANTPPREPRKKVVNRMVLFMNSIPCVDMTTEEPRFCNTNNKKETELRKIAGFSEYTYPTQVLAYAKYRDLLTIKTLYTFLYF